MMSELRYVYAEILGISANQLPPNYYQLLGVNPTTSTPQTLKAAAAKQAAKLQARLTAENQADCKQVMKQLRKAVACLSDPAAKAAYDQRLAERVRADQPRSQPIPERKTSPAGRSSPTRQLTAPVAGNSAVPPRLPVQPTRRSGQPPAAQAPKPAQARRIAEPASTPQKNLGLFVAAGTVVSLGIIALVAFLLISGPNEEEQRTASFEEPEKVSKPTKPLPKTTENVDSPKSMPSDDSTTLGTSQAKETNATTDEKAANLQTDKSDKPTLPVTEVNKAERDRQETVKEIPIEPVALPEVVELKAQVSLPQLRSNGNQLEELKPEDKIAHLGEISAELLAEARLQLDQLTHEAAGAYRFYTSNVKGAKNPTWEVRLKYTAPVDGEGNKTSTSGLAGGDFDEPIGKFYHEGQDLLFAWSKPEHWQQAEQLRNCTLEVNLGGKNHRVGLRETEKVPSFEVDLSEAAHRIDVQQEHMPPADAIFLEVTNVNLNGVGVVMDPLNGTVGKNKAVSIKLAKWQKAELQLKLTSISDKPVVRFRPRYLVDRKSLPMTTKGLPSTLRDMKDNVADLIRRGENAKAAIPELKRQWSREMAAVRGGNSIRSAQASKNVNKIDRQLVRADAAIKRANNQVPEMKAKITALEDLDQLCAKFHKQGAIEFRVFCELERGELELLKTDPLGKPIPQVARR